MQEQDDVDFSLPVERIRRVTTVLPAAKRRASTVAERAIPPELLLSLEERGSGFFRTLTSLDLQQRTSALLSGFPSQESLQILDDDDDDDDDDDESSYIQ